MSMLSLAVLAAAESESHELPVPPLVVGGLTLVILFGLMGLLIAFGGGREHS